LADLADLAATALSEPRFSDYYYGRWIAVARASYHYQLNFGTQMNFSVVLVHSQ
jgi:hypothetical protein